MLPLTINVQVSDFMQHFRIGLVLDWKIIKVIRRNSDSKFEFYRVRAMPNQITQFSKQICWHIIKFLKVVVVCCCSIKKNKSLLNTKIKKSLFKNLMFDLKWFKLQSIIIVIRFCSTLVDRTILSRKEWEAKRVGWVVWLTALFMDQTVTLLCVSSFREKIYLCSFLKNS